MCTCVYKDRLTCSLIKLLAAVMFGRKDKKGDRKRGREKEGKSGGGGGDLAGMFGLNMGPCL